MSQRIDIRFPDLVQRDEAARNQLAADQARLKERRRTAEEERDLIRITAVLDRLQSAPSGVEVADALFVAVRDIFNNGDLFRKTVQNHSDGVLKVSGAAVEFEDVSKIALVLGLLSADEVTPPRLVVRTPATSPTYIGSGSAIFADLTDRRYDEFSRKLYAAVGEANAVKRLAELVLSRLEEEGDPDVEVSSAGQVKSKEFALVVRCLRDKRIRVDEPVQLARAINECLDQIQGVGIARPLRTQSIALPLFNSEELNAFEIQADNIRLCQVPICVTMFDELKVFQVVDKLVEMAQDGPLNLARGDAGELLYRRWKDTPLRISESERRKFVAQSIGVPGGEVRGLVNRECNDLWSRFVSSVSELVRQQTTDKLLRDSHPSGIRQQQVRKAARDLARNLSSHTFGMGWFLALDCQDEVNKCAAILNHPEIKNLFGARDMWQVVDHVATLELGGARDTARYSTLATCGAIICAWLANNVSRYNKPSTRPVIDLDEVFAKDPPTAGPDATKDPTDYDLVNACELWTTDMAYSEEKVEELSQPRESPATTSRPVPIPSIARELLEQSDLAGLGLGLGLARR
jgi:hypothetical protein